MAFYIGTSGYSYKPWKGKFYPRDLPDLQMLRYYGNHFRAVEINNSFFSMPKPSVLEGWAGDVPAEFQFTFKAPRQITHFRKLGDVSALLSHLFDATAVLSDHRGPLLFQLPAVFKKDVARLRTFLALIPRQVRAAFEFRHASWFDEEVFGLLRDHAAALCVAEGDDDLEVPFEKTTDWTYLRLRKPDYGETELSEWVKRVRQNDWRDVFVFFKHEDEAHGPKFAKRLLELIAVA